jgi:hypothetical protein
MLNTKDLELIGEVINKTVPPIVHKIVHEVVNEVVPKMVRGIVHEVVNAELSEFAIMVQNGFREIMETKADKADVATKIDIENLESRLGAKIDRLDNKFEGRIEKVEDNIRVIKTKLKIA